MATNYLNIPLIWPFKMVPALVSPGIHFDNSWSHEQIKSFEMNQRYFQKWVKADKTILQIETTEMPANLKLLDKNGAVLKEFAWTQIYATPSYKIYNTEFDVTDISEKIVFLFQRALFGIKQRDFYSEPIHIQTSWPGTLLFKYRNSYLSQGVAWTEVEDMYFKFRCEAGLMEFQPKNDRVSYIDQLKDTETLSGVPYRNFKLVIGNALGVPPYVLDILNRIFCCDTVYIDDKRYQPVEGTEWEINHVKGNPWIGGTLEVTPALNLSSVSFNDEETLQRAMITTYQIYTRFFGGEQFVPIEEGKTE